jgi:uncharacterized protein with HEPN domain
MRRDEAYLLDILIASRRAIHYLEDLTWNKFEISQLHQDAVVYSLEIIGEAANKINNKFKDSHPEIPWLLMVGMRNRIVHEYFQINLATVWDTVQKDLPALITLIDPLVPSEDEFDALS